MADGRRKLSIADLERLERELHRITAALAQAPAGGSLSALKQALNDAPEELRGALEPLLLSTHAVAAKGAVVQEQSSQNRFLMGAGALAGAVALGLVVWSFVLGTLTPEQKVILRWALPIASGLAAGAFGGSMRIEGQWRKFGVAAGAGFGVWLLTFRWVSRLLE